MEAPRAVRPEEMDTLRALTDTVFRPGLMDQYPQLFNEDNRENLRVCVDAGRCVSHVGMTERGASFFGCALRVCCIGAVSTLPEYRGQGLASACFDDTVNKAYGDGVDVMIVSGNRSLYRMRGCVTVGHDTAFTLAPSTTPRALSEAAFPVSVEPMRDDELPLVQDCYRREPVRFLRPPDDYRHAIESGYVMNRPTDFLVVCGEQGAFLGYLLVQRPDEAGRAAVAEFGGDRRALLAALPRLFQRYPLTELRWQVQRHDDLFRSLCEQAGLPGAPAGAPGTVKLINFPQLMERMRPRWEEMLGRKVAAQLAFQQQGERYGFRLGDEELVTDRDMATRLVFGTLDGAAEAEALEQAGAWTEVLKAVLPLPCLWYGLNYV